MSTVIVEAGRTNIDHQYYHLLHRHHLGGYHHLQIQMPTLLFHPHRTVEDIMVVDAAVDVGVGLRVAGDVVVEAFTIEMLVAAVEVTTIEMAEDVVVVILINHPSKVDGNVREKKRIRDGGIRSHI